MARKPPRKAPRRPSRPALFRRWLGVGAILLVGYLYYHPLRTYLETRGQLGARRAEVAELADRNKELRRLVADSVSVDSLSRQARRLGYVRPGEHLFIVRGIAAWRKARTTIAGDGR